MATKSVLLAALALALAVATANAATRSFATEVTFNDAKELSYTFGDNVKFTPAATGTYKIKLTVPLNTAGKSKLMSAFVNLKQATGSPTGTPTVNSAAWTYSASSGYSSATSSASSFRWYSSSKDASTVCAGEYTVTFVVNTANVEFGFFVEFGEMANPVAATAGTVTPFDAFLFSNTNNYLSVAISSPLVAANTLVAMTMNVTMDNDVAMYNPAEIKCAGTCSPDTTKAEEGWISFSFDALTPAGYVPAKVSDDTFLLSIRIPAANELFYDLTKSLSATGTVTVSLSTPSTLSTSDWTTVSTGADIDATYYAVAVSEGWDTVEIEQKLADGDAPFTGQNKALTYSLDSGSTWTAYTGAIKNPVYAFPSGSDISTAVKPSPLALMDSFVYIKVDCTTTSSQKIRAKVNAIQGECKSYKDCNVNSDDHPGAGFVTSLRGEQQYLRQCMVLPSLTTPGGVTTRCGECQDDCDCSGGSYCHKDMGLCTDASNNLFVCDAASLGKAGLCVEKDPAGVIFGRSCRTDSFVGWTPSRTAGTTVTSSAVEDSSEDSPANEGRDFCGGFAAYNTSYQPTVVAKTKPALAGRVALWSGSCVEGICRECTENSCSEAKQCVNFELVPRIDVDGTIRTFNSNTVAGTVLAAVFGLILLNLLFACKWFHTGRSSSK